MLQCWCLDPPIAFHFYPVIVLWRCLLFFKKLFRVQTTGVSNPFRSLHSSISVSGYDQNDALAFAFPYDFLEFYPSSVDSSVLLHSSSIPPEYATYLCLIMLSHLSYRGCWHRFGRDNFPLNSFCLRVLCCSLSPSPKGKGSRG